MSVIQLSADSDTRKMLEALLEIALGDAHILWLDGQRAPDQGVLRRMFPPSGPKPGRPSSKPSLPAPEANPPDVYLGFWHDGVRLELDEHTADLVRQALAERIALMLVSASEPALAQLKLVYYNIDWDQVLREGVEVIETGATQGNRIQLETLEGK